MLVLLATALAETPAERFFDAYVAATRDGGAAALAEVYGPDVLVHWPGRAPFTDRATLVAELERLAATGCRTEVEAGLFREPLAVVVLASVRCPPVPGDAYAARVFPVASVFHVGEDGRASSSQTWITPAPLAPAPGTSAAAPLREHQVGRGPGTDAVRVALNLLPGEHVHPNQLAGDPWRTLHFQVLAGVFVGFDAAAPRRQPGAWDLQLVVYDDAGAIAQRRLYFAGVPLKWQPMSGRGR